MSKPSPEHLRVQPQGTLNFRLQGAGRSMISLAALTSKPFEIESNHIREEGFEDDRAFITMMVGSFARILVHTNPKP